MKWKQKGHGIESYGELGVVAKSYEKESTITEKERE